MTVRDNLSQGIPVLSKRAGRKGKNTRRIMLYLLELDVH